jgi:tRNA 2-thiouridine synthesizing protein A
MNIDYTILLDATQDDCPIPTIKTKHVLDGMERNEILKLLTCKDGAVRNIRTFVRNYACSLILEAKSEEGYVFYIQKS